MSMTIEKPDYSIYTHFDTWTLEDASNIMFSQYRYEKGSELSEDELNVKRERVKEILTENVRRYSDNIKRYPLLEEDGSLQYDEFDEPYEVVDFIETEVNIKKFIKFALVNKLPFPQVLVDAFMKLPIQTPKSSDEGANIKAEANDISGSFDVKYPKYTGLKFEELSKDKFDEIKKYYGMLQDEESKYRRALHIAAKIGILFYERSLGKPTTRPAFIKAYKNEFDSILKNDTIAKEIYNNLPEEYKGSSKPQDSSGDMFQTIKAAVFAGYMEGTQGDVTGSELSSSLREDGYAVPDEKSLQMILEAMSNLK